MTETPELDRAIAGAAKVIGFDGFEVSKSDRTYASALVAELLCDMDEEDADPAAFDTAFAYRTGYNCALRDVRRRAGLEGEG